MDVREEDPVARHDLRPDQEAVALARLHREVHAELRGERLRPRARGEHHCVARELSEAARVDGAGYWRTFVSIIVPISRNAMVTAGLFSFLFAWADFLFAVTLTTGQVFQPITVGIYRFVGNNSANWNSIMATAVLASIPAAILLVIAQRYVVAGMTSGAVKD